MTEQQTKQTLNEAGMSSTHVDLALSLIYEAERIGYARGVSNTTAGFDVTLANIAERLKGATINEVKRLCYDLKRKDYP